MKKAFKFFQWIISIFLIISSIGGYLEKEFLWASVILIFGALILPPVTRKLFGKKNKNNAIKTQTQNNYPRTINQTGDHLQTQRRGIQLLESLSIISTTKNIDTLKGRWEFLENIYPLHIEAAQSTRFISDMQKTLDQYKITFYERIPSEQEMSLLIKPSIDNLKIFYTECIFNCFNSFATNQLREIESLKKQDAKNRRFKKIREVAFDSRLELQEKGVNTERVKELQIEIDNVLNVCYERIKK